MERMAHTLAKISRMVCPFIVGLAVNIMTKCRPDEYGTAPVLYHRVNEKTKCYQRNAETLPAENLNPYII